MGEHPALVRPDRGECAPWRRDRDDTTRHDDEGKRRVAGEVATTRARGPVRAVTAVLALLLAGAAVGYYQRADSAAELRARDAASGAPDGEQAAPREPGTPSTEDTGAVTSGPGVTRPGILLRVTPVPGGALEVAETVRLRAPVDRIRLRAPRLGRAGGGFAELTPVATSVQLSLGDRPAEVPQEVGDDPTQVYLPVGTTAYTVRYLLEGTTVRSVPSTTGRALIGVGPLSQAGPAGRVNLVASGPEVLNLTCPLLEGNGAACGTPADDGFQLGAPLPGRSALVLVQVDLPEP